MKKFITIICFFVCVCVSCLTFTACDIFKGKNDLEKQGYKYDDTNDWYIKDGEEADGEVIEGTLVNLSNSDTNLSRIYVIDSSVNRVVFIGNSAKTYENFNIVVTGRNSNVYIELRNFKFQAQARNCAINAEDVSGDYTVYVISLGSSYIKGGAGNDGENGKSYNYNVGADNPKNGGNGYSGNIGYSAIKGNNVYITTNSSASLTIEGGNGGNGGCGGSGDGGSSPGIGQSGHGGNGGNGGQGGAAITIYKKLSIENSGIINFIGGNGGNGGAGGHGGENMDTLITDRADHGGNGGSGGHGGVGGFGIYLDSNAELRTSSIKAKIIGGNGGNGGNGNDGGSSCKNTFQSSNGGKPGNAGNGGSGGNGGVPLNLSAFTDMFNCSGGQGGYGGEAGNAGHSPVLGYGNSGSNGSSGTDGGSN